MAQDGLHRLHVAGHSQYASSQGAPPTVRAAELDTGLPVEPADRLLERITCPVHLRPVLQLAVLECQLKGLALVGHNQARVGPQAPVLNLGTDAPSSPERVKASQRGEPCESMSISHANNQSAARSRPSAMSAGATQLQ